MLKPHTMSSADRVKLKNPIKVHFGNLHKTRTYITQYGDNVLQSNVSVCYLWENTIYCKHKTDLYCFGSRMHTFLIVVTREHEVVPTNVIRYMYIYENIADWTCIVLHVCLYFKCIYIYTLHTITFM